MCDTEPRYKCDRVTGYNRAETEVHNEVPGDGKMYPTASSGSGYRPFQVIERAKFLLNRSSAFWARDLQSDHQTYGPRANLSHIAMQGTCHGVEQYLMCAGYRHERRTERTTFDALLARVRSRCCFRRCLCCGRRRILLISEGGVDELCCLRTGTFSNHVQFHSTAIPNPFYISAVH